MGDADRRVGRVDRLPARAGRALDVDPEVALLVDLDLDLVDLGQDDDRHGRGVDPARRLGRGDALDAMDAALELEAAVRAVAVDLDDRLLDAADPGLVEAQELGREAVALGVADVHPVELGGEQGRLVAAGAAADLHDHVAVVVRVARQEEDLQLLDQARLVGLEPVDLVAGHRLAARRRRRPMSRSSRAPASSARVASSRRKASTTGSRRASSWPSRRMAAGSVDVSGRASSAWRSSYWRAISASLASRSLMTRAAGRSERSAGVVVVGAGAACAVAAAAGSRRRRGVEAHRPLLELARALRDGLAVGDERLLHRHDGDLDHVVGRLLRRDHLDEEARVEQDLDQRVRRDGAPRTGGSRSRPRR